jgi:hypothetical protein
VWVSTMARAHGGERDETGARYVQRKVEVLTVDRSVLVVRDNGGSLSGAGIVTDHHREPLVDPVGRGDPHNWRSALDLDDPELELT